MSVQQVRLTDAEWQVMECLWAGAPMSGREVTQALEPKTGWSRSTILTLRGPWPGTAKGVKSASHPCWGGRTPPCRRPRPFWTRSITAA